MESVIFAIALAILAFLILIAVSMGIWIYKFRRLLDDMRVRLDPRLCDCPAVAQSQTDDQRMAEFLVEVRASDFTLGPPSTRTVLWHGKVVGDYVVEPGHVLTLIIFDEGAGQALNSQLSHIWSGACRIVEELGDRRIRLECDDTSTRLVASGR